MFDLQTYYKEVKHSNENVVFNMLLDVLTSIYKWDDLPETVRPEFVEMYLKLYGDCAIIDDGNGNIIAGLLNRGGAPDVYGLGTTPIVTTLNGKTFQFNEVINDVMYGANGLRGVIVYNNNTKTPDGVIRIFTNLLVEAITSFYQNIIHSRFNPVFAVNDDLVKRAVENSMDDIIKGKPVVIVASNIVAELETGLKPIEVIPITDVDKQEKIQFISKTIDDLLRWLLTIYGQAIQGNGKLAQQTVDEVNGTTSSSFIIPENGYRCRKKAADLINKTFGLNCDVGYNKPWAVEVEKYTEAVESTEEMNDESSEINEKEGAEDGEN